MAEQRERQPRQLEGRLPRLPAPPPLAPPPSPPRPPARPPPDHSPRPPGQAAAAAGRSKSPAGNVPRRRRLMAAGSPRARPPRSASPASRGRPRPPPRSPLRLILRGGDCSAASLFSEKAFLCQGRSRGSGRPVVLGSRLSSVRNGHSPWNGSPGKQPSEAAGSRFLAPLAASSSSFIFGVGSMSLSAR